MTTTTTATALTTYQIDAAHSEAAFSVRHLITKVRGRFSDFAGTIAFDAANPEQSTVRFTIQAASIDTNQKDRDTHLRSADFFETDTYAVTGNFTIRDVTREVTLPVVFLGTAKDPWGNERIAFETEYTVNRKDYGLTWNAALETGGFLVGDDVTVSLSIQAIPQA